MAEEELKIEEGGKKGKLMIIIIAAVVIIAGGAAAFFFLGGSDDDMADVQAVEGQAGAAPSASTGSAKSGTALYVAMPRPFVLNVPGAGRDRLVEIKVQLMVRGSDSEELAKSHIPLIEGTLLQVFSSSNADDLVTEAGKIALREQSLRDVQAKMQEIAGADVVEEVLFTGFVMQ
ncbi:flagellar basal body-associated protein FliL [Alteromonas oceanisediminis]|uniref:flagellar basal body-associated protein FliL n=1 Tax=Alteromonas oceanisediminis TaxID=2836180 RepID=UPI001BD9F14F|nr:flagellar basal body-associated protein FliL [Alteromonas oceanisediminis]MBT0584914.1 flagellar basal body-associated protein FliL [Alteromonas oceanisediminis]